MTTTTFISRRQPSRPSRWFQLFVPLLALFVGLGTASKVQAQSTAFYDEGVTFTMQPSGSNASTSTTYRGKYTAGDTPYNTYPQLVLTATGVVNNPTGTPPTGSTPVNLGAYDLGTSTLNLSAASLVIIPAFDTRTNTFYTVQATRVTYRVYLKGATTLPAYTSVPLADAGVYTGCSGGSGCGESYTNTATNVNLLGGLVTGGTYVVAVRYQVDSKDASNTSYTDADPANASYQAEFTLNAPAAPTLTGNTVYISANGGVTNTYNINPSTPKPFQGADLNTLNGNVGYNQSTGQLTLQGGSATTTESGTRTVTNVTLYYRVRQGSNAGGFNFVNLPQISNNNGTRTFGTSTAAINLLNNSAVTGVGSYSIDIYFQATGTDNTSTATATTPFTLTDDRGGSYYTATFDVTTAPTIPSTVWVGGTSDDWFTAGNWTNGVPDATTNAIIANLGTGNKNPYPNIYADTIYTYTGYSAAANGNITTTYNNTSKVAQTRNLTMSGNSQADRSILRIIAGRLEVNGDFNNDYDSFIARANTTVAFVGANQTISNGTFFGAEVGGSGVKSLTGTMSIGREIRFAATGTALLVTDITKPAVSVLVLADRAPINNNNGAQIAGEREDSYLRGFVRTTRATTVLGDDYTYGGMGMELIWSGPNNPGSVDVTRNTAQGYSPVNSRSAGIRRIFGVRPTNPQTNNGGLTAKMRFSYLENETKNLGANGSSTIPEQNLAITVSTNSGNTFSLLGRDSVDTVRNRVLLNTVRTFATFTMTDVNSPLPVQLAAFDAKRSGDNTLVTWATASETNNTGFEVQVSTNGTEFRRLGWVASASLNSLTYLSYKYTDIEAGKTGLRYYRLRQVDADGKYSYSVVKVVSFDGTAGSSVALAAYPNPFTDALSLTIEGGSAVHVKLVDVTGRIIREQDVLGDSNPSISGLSSLNAGVYLAKVTMADGSTQTMRIQKQ